MYAIQFGNKEDAAVTTVQTTKSIIAYIKGILNRMPTSGTVATASDIPLAVPTAIPRQIPMNVMLLATRATPL